MKKILMLLTSSVLATSGLVNLSSTLINQNSAFNFNNPYTNLKASVYDFLLKNWKTFKADYRNGCAVAAAQEVLNYYSIEMSQGTIAARFGFRPGGPGLSGGLLTRGLNRIFASNNLPPFFETNVRTSFGGNIDDMLAFQSYVISAFSQNSPVILGIAGSIPWLPHAGSGSHINNIIGINIVDDNPANTIYTVSENYDGNIHTFTGSQISQLFTNSQGAWGSLISAASGFDFLSYKPTCKVTVQKAEYSSHGSCTHETGVSFDLEKTVGIVSQNEMHMMEGINLPGFAINLNWGNTFHKQFGKVFYSPSNIYWNTDSSYEDTTHEFSWSSGWATTQLKMRYTFSEWTDESSLDNFLKFDWWMDTSANGWSSTAMSISLFTSGSLIYFSY